MAAGRERAELGLVGAKVAHVVARPQAHPGLVALVRQAGQTRRQIQQLVGLQGTFLQQPVRARAALPSEDLIEPHEAQDRERLFCCALDAHRAAAVAELAERVDERAHAAAVDDA